MVYVIFCGMALGILLLSVKLYLLKKSAREITSALERMLREDTNTGLRLSSRDKDMRALASAVNVQFKAMRRAYLRYRQGDRELKTAVTNLSHDLRTPLTAISGYLYMMQKTEDIDKMRSYLSILSERTQVMQQLTEELLRYSVIQSEAMPPSVQVNVGQVLEDSIMGYYGALQERGIQPSVQITEQKIIRYLNRADLSRVFSNLLNNALKYSDGDLTITLTETGEITFSNTAAALSTVEVEQLFDRFYTVEAAHPSTGLGLSIAKTLVERMGGTITAKYLSPRLMITICL